MNVSSPDAYGERWAAVYDREHRFRDPAPAVALLAELADGRTTLELGIGTGRVALPLAAAGTAVRGVDSSSAMIERLRAKPGGDEIEVALGDMAAMPLGGPHGLIFVVFNTFFGLESQERQIQCLHNVASALEPGGLFLIECFVPDVARFADGGQTVRVVALDDSHVRLNASIHDAATQTVRTQVVTVRDGVISSRPFALRYCWPAELDVMARLAGLELAHPWSGWNRKHFDSRATQNISVYRRS